MKTLMKFAAVTVAVALGLTMIVPMALQGKISEAVKREADRILAVQMDFEKLDISLLRHFPRASVEMTGLTLRGDGPFEGDTLAAASRISVVVDLMSLFGESGFEVSKVVLSAPHVHARKLADGRVNWLVMKPAGASGANDEGSVARSGNEGSPFRLSIRDLRIEDAVIRYADDSASLCFATDPLSLRLRGDLSAERTELELELEAAQVCLVSGAMPLLSGADLRFEARIDADLARKRFELSHNRLCVNAVTMGLDGWLEQRGGAWAVDLKAGCDKVQFKEILSLIPAFYAREYRSLTAGGELSMALWTRGEMCGAKLPAFELRAEVRDGSFQYASMPQSVTGIQLAACVSNPGGTMDRTVVDLSKFEMRMAENSLSATFHATDLVSDPHFRFSVDGVFDLGSVGRVYPLEQDRNLKGLITADLKLAGALSDVEHLRYEHLEARGTMIVEGLEVQPDSLPDLRIRRAAATVTPAAMTLGELDLAFGRSDLSANGQLGNYLGWLLHRGKLAGRLYVKSELIDLNEIMASMPLPEEHLRKQPVEAAEEPVRVLQIPTQLDLSLHVDLRKVFFEKMTLEHLSGETAVREGVLSLDKLSLGIFGGRALASGRYSAVEDPLSPALQLDASVEGASFQKSFEELDMVRQLVPLFARTGGVYAMKLNLKSRLDSSMSPVWEHFNATGEIRSFDIRLQQVELFDAMAKVLDDDRLRHVEVRDVVIRFAVEKGRITTQPFDLKLGGVGITLSGSTGLDRRLDYKARVSLPVGGSLQRVGLHIGGTSSSPKISLGLKETAEEAVANLIGKELGGSPLSGPLSDEEAGRLRQEARLNGEKLVAAAREQRDRLMEQAADKGALARLAARTAGDKLVEVAEQQADRMLAEAERRIGELSASDEVE